MSMIECSHCRRPADARMMAECTHCGTMVCEECMKNQEDCETDLDMP
jgi:hypothetical protein